MLFMRTVTCCKSAVLSLPLKATIKLTAKTNTPINIKNIFPKLPLKNDGFGGGGAIESRY